MRNVLRPKHIPVPGTYLLNEAPRVRIVRAPHSTLWPSAVTTPDPLRLACHISPCCPCTPRSVASKAILRLTTTATAQASGTGSINWWTCRDGCRQGVTTAAIAIVPPASGTTNSQMP